MFWNIYIYVNVNQYMNICMSIIYPRPGRKMFQSMSIGSQKKNILC